MGEHDGHRQRMIERLIQGTLKDHEYLEGLLYFSIARRNTNDIAHRLLARFGDINGVLNASFEELNEVEGVGVRSAELIKIVDRFCLQYRPYSVEQDVWPETYEWNSFLAFVKHKYGSVPMERECLDAYLIDSEAKFYGCRRFSGREAFKVVVPSDAFAELLVRERPSGILLVHNHPFGDPEPSAADDETTKCFQDLCELHGSVLCEHLIYAKDGIYSYYRSGRLLEFKKKAEDGKERQNGDGRK